MLYSCAVLSNKYLIKYTFYSIADALHSVLNYTCRKTRHTLSQDILMKCVNLVIIKIINNCRKCYKHYIRLNVEQQIITTRTPFKLRKNHKLNSILI